MAYRHNDSFHKHKVTAHRLRKFTFFAVILVLIVSAVVGVDFVIGKLSTGKSVVSRETTSSVQSANISVYRTEFFQFQAPDEWVVVSDRSTEKKFVYVKNDGSLISQRLVVYVDLPESVRAEQNISHLLPIELDTFGNFVPLGSISDHCDTSWPQGLKRNRDRIVHEGIELECTPNTQEYNIMVGKVGGSDRIPVTLNDGREITVTIVFSDLTAYPSAGDVFNIVKSFNTL